jgi:hypothetical protein
MSKSYRRVETGRGTFKHHYKGEEPSKFTKRKLNKAARRGAKKATQEIDDDLRDMAFDDTIP